MQENSLVLPTEREEVADFSGGEPVDVSETDDQALAIGQFGESLLD